MGFYTAVDAAMMLHVKTHVIRYWEREIPLIQSKKNHHGKRYYSERDMQILMRLKHLLYDKHFTVEGAKEELIREISGEHQDLRAQITELRSQLMELYFLVKEKEA